MTNKEAEQARLDGCRCQTCLYQCTEHNCKQCGIGQCVCRQECEGDECPHYDHY